jgi:hypothetical protein
MIGALHSKGHVVGFLGDGINDSPTLKAADVGISVDTAVDIAKESADIILLEKSLMVLRKVFGNITKDIKMGASSNFGNMFSVLGASIFLPLCCPFRYSPTICSTISRKPLSPRTTSMRTISQSRANGTSAIFSSSWSSSGRSARSSTTQPRQPSLDHNERDHLRDRRRPALYAARGGFEVRAAAVALLYHYRRVPIDLCNPDAFGENLVRPPLGYVNRHHRQKAGGTNAAPDHAPFTIDEFKFGEAQEETYMIEAFARDLGGEFFSPNSARGSAISAPRHRCA